MASLLSSLHAGVDTEVGDRIMANQLARSRERMEQDKIREMDALRKVVGGQMANDNFAGARKAAFEGGALDMGSKISEMMASQSEAERKRMMDGFGRAAALSANGITGDQLVGVMQRMGFVDDDEDAQFFAGGTPELFEGMSRESEKIFKERFETAEREAGQEFRTDEREAGQRFQRSERLGRQSFTAQQNELARQERAQAAQAKARGKKGDPKMMASKAINSLARVEEKNKLVLEEIDRVIEAVEDQGVLGGVTGLSGKIPRNVPGTGAYNAQKSMETIQANIGFDALQEMRDNSPTGGALGQVSERELNFLQATEGNLDLGQDDKVVLRNLKRLRQRVLNREKRMREAFQRDFGDIQDAPERSFQTSDGESVTMEDIEHTAQQNNVSVDEVMQRLGIR